MAARSTAKIMKVLQGRRMPKLHERPWTKFVHRRDQTAEDVDTEHGGREIIAQRARASGDDEV